MAEEYAAHGDVEAEIRQAGRQTQGAKSSLARAFLVPLVLLRRRVCRSGSNGPVWYRLKSDLDYSTKQFFGASCTRHTIA